MQFGDKDSSFVSNDNVTLLISKMRDLSKMYLLLVKE